MTLNIKKGSEYSSQSLLFNCVGNNNYFEGRTLKMNKLAIALLSFLSFSTLLHAANDDAILISIINDIKYGWENGDGVPFRKHYLDFDGAKYIESGGQNDSLEDLVVNHVEPEKDSLEFLTLDFSAYDIHVENQFAWVVADTRVKGKVKSSGKEFDKSGFQTFLFKQINNTWKVIHTHSSSRDTKPDKHKH
tara:strand:+ start:3922 stop:4494 length:573 start_codon:yes stop_codon:yes gene_type:complete